MCGRVPQCQVYCVIQIFCPLVRRSNRLTTSCCMDRLPSAITSQISETIFKTILYLFLYFCIYGILIRHKKFIVDCWSGWLPKKQDVKVLPVVHFKTNEYCMKLKYCIHCPVFRLVTCAHYSAYQPLNAWVVHSHYVCKSKSCCL